MMTRNNNKIATCFAFALLALASIPMAAAEGKVNVNSAEADQLSLLPRIGEVVAQRIIDFRAENGRFSQPEELMLVEGIGEKTFELIEPWISLEGDTTLTEKVRVKRAEADK